MFRVLGAVRRRRALSLFGLDTGAWIFGLVSFTLIRYVLAGYSLGGAIAQADWLAAVGMALGASVLHGALGLTMRLHQGRFGVSTLDEMFVLGTVVLSVGTVITTVNLVAERPVPGTVPFVATLIAMFVMGAARGAYRAWRERHFSWQRPGLRDREDRVVVMGAGAAGQDLIRSMFRDPASRWVPVALLDDNRFLRHRRIMGVPVVGTSSHFDVAVDKYGATVCVLALPSAPSSTIRTLTKLATDVGLAVKVLPSTNELLEPGRARISDIRDIEVADLLGRNQVDTDLASIASYLTGKRILVTGAGGSIGSELCRQIVRHNPAEMIMLDRDESALHAVQLSIYGRALLDSNDVVLGDIRDSLFIDALFARRKPHVVFHAAALKHLPMLEQYPGEAVETNVWGTLSILEAAKAHGVEKFVNISTDKAANPCSVLGYSKRLAEGLTSAIAEGADGTFLSVRFGNVLGSRGSVLTSFASQIASGGPVTVTDAAVTRYFMTVEEAVQLVVQAAAIGRDGEALVLDMGEPVSIDGVARQLIEMSGQKGIDIVYTGLRDGEKLHEELWGDGETDVRPVHPRVSHTVVPRFDPLTARELDPWAGDDQVIEACKRAVRGMRVTAIIPRQSEARVDDAVGVSLVGQHGEL